MFCIKTIVLMTLGFSVSFSIFRISYQTGKDNDAAGWEISGFAGAGTWKIRKCIDTWNACRLEPWPKHPFSIGQYMQEEISILTSDHRSLYN